jgi:hypothetical protein
MPTYEVVVVYKGQQSYIVNAISEAIAEVIAAEKFRLNEPHDKVGTEYEDIEKLVTYKCSPQD